MLNSFFILKDVFLQAFSVLIVIIAIIVAIVFIFKKKRWFTYTIPIIIAVLSLSYYIYGSNRWPSFQYPLAMKTYGLSSTTPVLPFKNIFRYLYNLNNIPYVKNIARDPNDIPPRITRKKPAIVDIAMEVTEVNSEIAPGVYTNYWTFNMKVPGPFLRVREGDTVRLTLKNNPNNLHTHSIDLHAATGPGGGAVLTGVPPGKTKVLVFKALHPGLFIYHCASPNLPLHVSHGMYGMILVQPKDDRLPKVDKEFYVMQGEFYATGKLGAKGLEMFDGKAMMNGHPKYIVFNGKVGSLIDNMNAKTGDKLRFFVGNAGVNLISSFHIIGEVMDTVYPEAAIGKGSSILHEVQTTIIPAGGAIIVDLNVEVPGKFILLDHALARTERGLWGFLHVTGPKRPDIYRQGKTPSSNYAK